MVYASTRRIDEAIQVAERARRLATESDDPAIAALVPQIGLSIHTFRDLKEQGVAASDVLSPPENEETPVETEQEQDAAAVEPSDGVPIGAPGE